MQCFIYTWEVGLHTRRWLRWTINRDEGNCWYWWHEKYWNAFYVHYQGTENSYRHINISQLNHRNTKTLRIFSFAGFLLSLSYKEGGVRSVNSLFNDDFTLTCPTFSDNLLSKNLIEGKKLFPLSFLFIHVDTFVTFLSCN